MRDPPSCPTTDIKLHVAVEGISEDQSICKGFNLPTLNQIMITGKGTLIIESVHLENYCDLALIYYNNYR